jgi:hypothetical protein
MVRRSSLVAAILVLAGCAPSNPGLLVSGALEPLPGLCQVMMGGIPQVRGTLDVTSARVSYTLNVGLLNNLTNVAQPRGAPPRADSNAINLRSAQVELRDVTGAPFALPGLPNPYTVPAAGFIQSSMDGMMGTAGVASIQIIPPAYGETLREIVEGTVVASVRVVGVTAGDSEVISPEFVWPIEICSGCLYECVRDDDGAALCVPSCFPGQDEVTITPSACTDELVESCAAPTM